MSIKNEIVYLATPYSHPELAVQRLRFEQVSRLAAELMSRGVYVYSPISHTHPIAMAGYLPTGWDFWEAHNRTMLSRCDRLVVYMQDGWEESVGVAAEIAMAEEFGLPIEYLEA